MELKALLRLPALRWLAVAELAVALLALAAGWATREATLRSELRTLASLARAMALQADRTLGVADSVLRDTRDELARGLVPPTGAATDALLRDRVRPLDSFRAIAVFDADGHRVATSRGATAPAPLSVRERDFFREAAATGEPQVYVSEPYVALADGQPATSVSMNWRDADGRFRGAIALVADPGFLEGGFERIAATPDTRLAVYRIDGRPLHPERAAGLLSAAQVQALRLRAAASVTERLQGADGRPQLVAAAALGRYALTVVVARDRGAVLAAWRDTATAVGGFVALALAVTFALTLRIAQERERRHALERQLQRAGKLQALGKLAGGVAHDFNNVLAAVVGYGEMARGAAAEGSAQAAHLDQVLQAGERGRQIAERILAFSRGQPRLGKPFALQPVVAEVLDQLAPRLPPGVVLQRVLQAPALVVRGDPAAAYEAVLNLATNALQAMPAGGTLHVALAERRTTSPLALYDGPLPPGRWAELVVADTGTGMSPDVLGRLFEPFFSTRAAQGGSGLGLAVVHGVAHEFGGGIAVESRPGAGTRLRLYLAATDELPADEAASPAAVPAGRGETVLVVDDEPALVALAEELLAGLGYEPLGTPSPEAALAAFRAEPQRFDLLLTDERMPGMAGTALARELRTLRPGLPVVLASGYAGPGLEARAAEAGIAVVVAKPLTRAALAQAVARALKG